MKCHPNLVETDRPGFAAAVEPGRHISVAFVCSRQRKVWNFIWALKFEEKPYNNNKEFNVYKIEEIPYLSSEQTFKIRFF